MGVTTRSDAATIDGAAALVTEQFARTFADLEPMRLALLDRFTQSPATSAQINALVEPYARGLLADGLLLGTGFVAGRDALSDTAWHLAWWQGQSQQLLGESGSVTGDPLDYTKREWFRRPLETGERHVTGPYVDYVCSDEYVVTCTQPVLVDGRMLGVVGSDILAETLERLLLKNLTAAGVILVNRHGRAVISADHTIAAGELVDVSTYSRQVACGDFPLTVMAR